MHPQTSYSCNRSLKSELRTVDVLCSEDADLFQRASVDEFLASEIARVKPFPDRMRGACALLVERDPRVVCCRQAA